MTSMKTEIDALINALEAFRAKLVESEQPPVAAEDWIYLHEPRYALREYVDWCQNESGVWSRVDGLRDATIEYARRSGYLAFRCLRKDSPYPCHQEPEVLKPVDPEKELLTKAQSNSGDGVEVDSYHRLGWYRMAGGGIARIKRTYDEIACSIVFGDVVEAGSTFTDQVWNKTTGTHETNSDWNLIRWKGSEQ